MTSPSLRAMSTACQVAAPHTSGTAMHSEQPPQMLTPAAAAVATSSEQPTCTANASSRDANTL
jgi:hypothetical protein